MATYYVDGAVGNDANAGTSAGAGNAWATIGHALSTATGANDLTWVKSSASYSISATLTYPSGRNDLPNSAPYYILGYTTTTGDGGMPTITTGSAIDLLTIAGNNFFFGNFILDCGTTATRGIKITAGNPDRGCRLSNLIIKNGFTTYGIDSFNGVFVGSRLLIMGGASGAGGGLGGIAYLSDSAIVNNKCRGVSFIGNNMGDAVFDRIVVANNNSGGTYAGLYLQSALGNVLVKNSVLYNNSGDGIDMSGTYAAVSVINSILVKNGGYGINGGFSTTVANLLLDLNAYYLNTSGPVHNVIAGSDDVTLTGDPFANPSGSVTTLADVWTNFALNSTAGAGAACNGVAYPANLDIGAVQSAAGGAGGGLLVHPGMTGGMHG